MACGVGPLNVSGPEIELSATCVERSEEWQTLDVVKMTVTKKHIDAC
jgi:hypothetical protein